VQSADRLPCHACQRESCVAAQHAAQGYASLECAGYRRASGFGERTSGSPVPAIAAFPEPRPQPEASERGSELAIVSRMQSAGNGVTEGSDSPSRASEAPAAARETFAIMDEIGLRA
jgi:hypothetical protein